jgi:N-acetylneuraminic acid mutarotase
MATWHLPFASGRQAIVPLRAGVVLLAGGLLPGDVSTDRVSEVAMPPLAVPVHDTAGGVAGGVPVVVGGGNATEQDAVQALRGGRWRVVGHLPTTRSDLGVVDGGGEPLVVGGFAGAGTPLTLLRVGADGSVRPDGRLALGVRYAATAVDGRVAYVFGGEVLGHELDAVQQIDLHTGRTTVVARLPVALGHAMAARVGDRILLMGGRVTPSQQTAAMWWFDPRTRRFTRAGTLPEPRSDAAVAIAGHRVWLLGGEDPSVTDSVVFVNLR